MSSGPNQNDTQKSGVKRDFPSSAKKSSVDGSNKILTTNSSLLLASPKFQPKVLIPKLSSSSPLLSPIGSHNLFLEEIQNKIKKIDNNKTNISGSSISDTSDNNKNSKKSKKINADPSSNNNNSNNSSNLVSNSCNKSKNLKSKSVMKQSAKNSCAGGTAVLNINGKKSNKKQANFGLSSPSTMSSTNAVGGLQKIMEAGAKNVGKFEKRDKGCVGASNAESATADIEDNEENRSKKKRCSDRYDSSESSDSGVATSLSCTDSSTASSDASDPGSPYSSASLSDDAHQSQSPSSKLKMPPQTILATNASSNHTAVGGGVSTTQKQQKPQQQQSQQQTQVPPLRKTMTTTTTGNPQWPWNASTANSSLSATNINKTSTSNNSTGSNKNKRFSSSTCGDLTNGTTTAKKTRITNNANNLNSTTSNAAGDKLYVNSTAMPQSTTTTTTTNGSGAIVPSSANIKRLKAAAMEESQTKITGYFKSQMKPLNTVYKKDSSNNSKIDQSAAATAANLNKYFNLLSSQAKDDQQRAVLNALATTISSLTTTTTSTATNGSGPKTDYDVRTLSVVSNPPPTLKKLERSKPTKVAQVAPNLRKPATTVTMQSQQQQHQLLSKSPKKHVPIAPRTAEMKTPKKNETNAKNQMEQQPTVLLTAIRIPQHGQQPTLQPQPTMKQQQPNLQNSSNVINTAAYQIPVMPNLVQIPNLLAAANQNLLMNSNGQLARMANNAGATAQYFLNGAVFKLQQMQMANAANGNNVTANGILTVDNALGNLLVKQSMGQSVMPLQTTTTTTTATISAMQQSQVKACATSTTATAQQFTTTNSRLTTHQQLFMATPAGLLLNTTLPTMIATQQAKPHQQMNLHQQALPALQPIQSNSSAQSTNLLPSLSTILQHHHQQQNILQMPPLQPTSSYTTNNSAYNKHTISSSEPPPLVTISSNTASNNAINNQGTIGRIRLPAQKKTITTTPLPKPIVIEPELVQPKPLEAPKEKTPNPPVPIVALVPIKVGELMEDNKSISAPKPPPPPPPPAPPTPFTQNDLFDQLKNSKNEKNVTTKLGAPPTAAKNVTLDISNTPDPIKYEEPEPSTSSSSPTPSSLSATNDTSLFSNSLATPTTIDMDIVKSESLPISALSPILSQPKTIRFPAFGEPGYRYGQKGTKRHDGVCYWEHCAKKHESSSKLLDHLQTHHVNTQTGPFACLWMGCKVHGRESCSRRWLERHVLSHGGTKPFKCIVDGCGLRFGSQLALQKHVNGHFNNTESKDSTSKRTSDPPVPKLLRKNGKKLRYRRQPFSARMFDFFDAGIMEGINHRLAQISTITGGKSSITFHGTPTIRRTTMKGIAECLVQWIPSEIIPDEWLPVSDKPFFKTVNMRSMKTQEKIRVGEVLQATYRPPQRASCLSLLNIKREDCAEPSSIPSFVNEVRQKQSRKQQRKPMQKS